MFQEFRNLMSGRRVLVAGRQYKVKNMTVYDFVAFPGTVLLSTFIT
jgi:hypothetical protein